MMTDAGLILGGVTVSHPSDVDGDVKLLNALTMENIAEAVLNDGLATPEEVRELLSVLNASTQDKGTFASITRTIQVWARKAV